MLGGSPTDNNAILFRKGQDEIVQPYVDKGVITVVADQWADNWDAANALKLMENILTAQKNAAEKLLASVQEQVAAATAALAAAEAEARRSQSAASAAKVSGDGPTMGVVSLI